MEFEEFIVGEEVTYKGHEDWGKGIVELLFEDTSLLIRFPDRPSTHPMNTNLFRYYSYELKHFIKRTDMCKTCKRHKGKGGGKK